MASRTRRKVPDQPPLLTFTCSFCGRSNTEVAMLIAGNNDAYICDECVETARDIVGHHRHTQKVAEDGAANVAAEAAADRSITGPSRTS